MPEIVETIVYRADELDETARETARALHLEQLIEIVCTTFAVDDRRFG